ncbi:MAG: rhomboid family intramembrane serine protease [Cellulomonadaceae bacterium]
MDCVTEQARSVRAPRSALGAPLRSGRPIVTLTLIGLCVVSFVLQHTLGWERWTARLVFAPFLGDVEPWRFLTAAFLHSTGNIAHILFNMYALWITGQFLEPMLGRARFLALYVLSALGGSVGVLLLASPQTDSWYTPVLGASGAVFGLFGALLVVLRRLDRNAMQILVLIAINLALGFIIPGVAWQAHVGGLVVGAAMGLGFAHAPRDRRAVWGVLVPAVAAVALVALALVTYASVG